MVKVQSSTSGYPRIGGKREWKRALESFWSGAISEEQLTDNNGSTSFR